MVAEAERAAAVPVRVQPPRFLLELLLFGGTLEGGNGRGPGRDDPGDLVEVAGAHLALVLGGGVAVGLGAELGLLQRHVGRHLALAVALRQFEHAVVQRVETGQGDELELVAHGRQLALEPGNRGVVQVLLPVERR